LESDQPRRGVLLAALAVIILIAVGSVGYHEITNEAARSSSGSTFTPFSTIGFVTGTSVSNASDTYVTRIGCVSSSGNGLELRIVSDSTGAPVSGETVNAIEMNGPCIAGSISETQVLYIGNFSEGQGGWLMPIFPPQAESGGRLDLAVTYQGRSYNFSGQEPGVGSTCLTLHVPSGDGTTTTVFSSIGSICS